MDKIKSGNLKDTWLLMSKKIRTIVVAKIKNLSIREKTKLYAW